MKSTPLFSATLEVLERQAKPLSVPILLELLDEKGLQPNKTSLYRMLEKLVKEGSVESVLLSNKTAYYEFKRSHHHHFVCRSCDDIQCLEDPKLEDQIHKLEDQLQCSGLKIEDHQFSFYGCCVSCS